MDGGCHPGIVELPDPAAAGFRDADHTLLRVYTPAMFGCQSRFPGCPELLRARPTPSDIAGSEVARSGSLSGHAAVDADHLAIDVRRGIRAQERHHARDFRRRAGARGGNHRFHLVR